MLGMATDGPADVGLLISILHTAEAEIWRNVGVSVRRLQPRWSSLAVDLWNRPSNASATATRQAIWQKHEGVLSLFSRVLYLDTAPRMHVPSHVRPSFSYRLHWSSAFADPASRLPFGMHSEGLPELLVGVDADVEVPRHLPLARIADLLAESTPAPDSAVALARARARDIWVGGRTPTCSSSARSSTRAAAAAAARVRTDGSLASPCEVVTENHQPVFVSPRDLRLLKVEKRTSFAELGMYMSPLGLGNCCGRQNINAPEVLRRRSGAAVATLARGPYCPPSTFFISHRRHLDRLLDSFRLWQEAWDEGALTRDMKRVRWEYVACSLLAPGEAGLLLYYNMSG